MNGSFEDQIRERAYQIWLAGGMADGEAHAHWLSAEQTLLGQMAAARSDKTDVVVIMTEAVATKPKTVRASAKATKPAAAKVADKTTRARKAKAAH